MYQRMPMGLNISPSIWQSYINTILDCLKIRKHCKAIMDDLLLFTPTKKAHMAKLEDLLRHLQTLTVSFPECFPPDCIAKLKCDHFYGRLPKWLKAMVAYLKASANEKMYSDYL